MRLNRVKYINWCICSRAKDMIQSYKMSGFSTYPLEYNTQRKDLVLSLSAHVEAYLVCWDTNFYFVLDWSQELVVFEVFVWVGQFIYLHFGWKGSIIAFSFRINVLEVYMVSQVLLIHVWNTDVFARLIRSLIICIHVSLSWLSYNSWKRCLLPLI